MDVKGEVHNFHELSVLPHVVRDYKGNNQILLQERHMQPYFGDIGTVAGKVLPGESVEDAASRKLYKNRTYL